MAFHPIVQHIAKMTPEQINALAAHLTKINAPLPNLAALNPALQQMQVIRAMQASPNAPVPPGTPGAAPAAPTQPIAPQPSVVKPAAPTLEQSGQNLGTVSGDAVRQRNPYANFTGA